MTDVSVSQTGIRKGVSGGFRETKMRNGVRILLVVQNFYVRSRN